jgi:hypothetical protein
LHVAAAPSTLGGVQSPRARAPGVVPREFFLGRICRKDVDPTTLESTFEGFPTAVVTDAPYWRIHLALGPFRGRDREQG